jgi:DNA-binding transcriptional LysR family regulator
VPSRQINLARLAHFVTVADAGSMTLAATELHLTQQAISTSIRQLERELGVALFDRVGRRLELTPAGIALRAGATTLLSAARSLAGAAADAARETPRPYVVAHTPAITSDEVFLLLAPIREALPGLPIEVHQTYPKILHAGLLDTTFDLGLRRGVVPPTDLAGAVVSYDPLNIAVMVEHPLAARNAVAMSDLAPHPLTVWAPPGSSFYTDYLLSVCRRAGFEPSVHVNHIQGTTPATAVIGTDTFAFVTQEPGITLGGRVAIVAISDAPLAPVQALWLPHTHAQPLEALLRGTVERRPAPLSHQN